jgi:hypothetical protein
MISRVPCTTKHQVSMVCHRIPRIDLRLSTPSCRKKLPGAESTIMNALVTHQAIVVAFMKKALYAKRITAGALQPAELDASPEVYHCVVERPAQLFHACMLGLETLYVRLQPLIYVGDA